MKPSANMVVTFSQRNITIVTYNPNSIRNDNICNANSVASITTINRLILRLKELPFLSTECTNFNWKAI